MIEYNLISHYYNQKKAKRSGIPYINHIDEGLKLISFLNSDYQHKYNTVAHAAFCLHPLFQDNIKFDTHSISGYTLKTSYLYSIIANTFLRNNYEINDSLISWIPNKASCSTLLTTDPDKTLGPTIKTMLIADKVQNYKDARNHKDKYTEWKSINNYFLWWFDTLNVTHSQLSAYISVIS